MGLQLRGCPVEKLTIDFEEDVCVHEDVGVQEDVRLKEDVCVHEFEWYTVNHHRPEADICGTYDRHVDHMKTRRKKNCFSLTRKKNRASFTTTTLTKAMPCHHLDFLDLKRRLQSFEMAPVHERCIIRQLGFVGFFWDANRGAVRCIWCGLAARRYIPQLILLLSHESDCKSPILRKSKF